MAKFTVNESAGDWSMFETSDEVLSVDELLECLRPAALRLKEHYINTINRLFKRRSGQLADSIEIEDNYTIGKGNSENHASITVAPYGKREGSKRSARSRKGDPNARYAKHNRDAKATRLANAELAYLLEFGTPRITATHWMENTNKEVGEEIQQMIEDEFNKLLDRKGL